MLTRACFLQLAGSLGVAAATPHPVPTATPYSWDTCFQNPVLPYDRPLDLQMRVLDGPDFHLMKYRGSPTILHIFATWCEPCAYEMPYVVDVSAKYAAAGLKVVGIDIAESDNAVRAYRKKFAIPFPIAMDANGGFTRALETGGAGNEEIPVSLYVTPSGYLYCYTRGTTKNAQRELTYRVEKFLRDAPPLPQPSQTP